MAITLNQIKKELVNLLRNSDIISASNRGVTTSSDSGTFAADSNYTISINPTKLKNIRSITVASILLKYGVDYTFSYSTGVITFTENQTGSYSIIYDTGNTDRIWPDYPQANLKLSQFPRLAVDIISSSSSEFGIGASTTQSTYSISIIGYSISQEEIEDMISSVKDLLMSNKKSLFYSSFITPTETGPILVSEFGNNKVFQRNQDAQVRFSFDTN